MDRTKLSFSGFDSSNFVLLKKRTTIQMRREYRSVSKVRNSTLKKMETTMIRVRVRVPHNSSACRVYKVRDGYSNFLSSRNNVFIFKLGLVSFDPNSNRLVPYNGLGCFDGGHRGSSAGTTSGTASGTASHASTSHAYTHSTSAYAHST